MKFLPALKRAASGLVVFWASAAVAAPNCVEFQGIDHCPLGSAQLEVNASGSLLIATNLGSDGSGGVASLFDKSTTWRAKMKIPNPRVGQRALLSSVADGFVTSTAQIELGEEGMFLRTTFTGTPGGTGTHHVVLLRAGQVVAQVEGLESADTLVIRSVLPTPEDCPPYCWPEPIPGDPIPGGWDIPWEPIPWPPERWPPWDPEGPDGPDLPSGPTFTVTPIGACMWGAHFDQDVEVFAGSASLGVGDELRVVEDIVGPGNYPYDGFDSILTQTNGPVIVVQTEFVSNGF